MRARTIFIILLVLIFLVAFGPAPAAIVSQSIAEAFGCQVDLNRVVPCVIGGKDYGQTFLRSRLSDLVFLSIAAGRRGAVRRVAGSGHHRLPCQPDTPPIRNAVEFEPC